MTNFRGHFCILVIFLLTWPIFSAVLEDDKSDEAVGRNSENKETGETNNEVKEEELEAFLNLMEEFDSNKTDNGPKIKSLLFEEDGGETRSRFLGGLKGSMTVVDFPKYWDNLKQIMDFIAAMKEYSDIICPFFAEIDVEGMRVVLNELIDLALKPKNGT